MVDMTVEASVTPEDHECPRLNTAAVCLNFLLFGKSDVVYMRPDSHGFGSRQPWIRNGQAVGKSDYTSL